MRLTYKLNDKEYAPCKNTGWKTFDKLGQLEDIEDELGIDLITLFKALKNGIYFKVKDKIYFTNGLDLDFKEKVLFEFNEYEDFETYELKDYGKTWALTEEELIDKKERTLPL